MYPSPCAASAPVEAISVDRCVLLFLPSEMSCSYKTVYIANGAFCALAWGTLPMKKHMKVFWHRNSTGPWFKQKIQKRNEDHKKNIRKNKTILRKCGRNVIVCCNKRFQLVILALSDMHTCFAQQMRSSAFQFLQLALQVLYLLQSGPITIKAFVVIRHGWEINWKAFEKQQTPAWAEIHDSQMTHRTSTVHDSCFWMMSKRQHISNSLTLPRMSRVFFHVESRT